MHPAPLCFSLALAACAWHSSAQTATWLGPSGGDWNSPANWDIGVPGPATNAILPAATTVNYSLPMAAPSFGSLNLSGTLNVSATGFFINEAGSSSAPILLASNAVFNINSGGAVTLSNSGGAISIPNGATLSIAANASLIAASSSGSTGLNVGSSGNPAKGGKLIINGTLTLDKVLNIAGTPTSVFVNGGTLNCLGGSRINENNNDGGQRLAVSGSSSVFLGNFSVTRCDSSGGLLLTNGVVNASAIQIGTANSMAFSSVFGGILTNSGLFTISDTSNIGASGDRRSQFLLRGGLVVSTSPNGIVIANQSNLSSSPSAGGSGLGGVLDISSGTLLAEKLTLIKDNTITNAYAGFFLSGSGVLYLGSGGLIRNSGAGHVGSAINLSGGTLGAKANWSSSAKMALTNTVTFKTADPSGVPYNIALSGILSGSGSLTKTAPGTLTLSAPNTYSGNTTISAGSLLLGAPGALPPGTALTLGSSGNSALLDLAGFNILLSSLSTASGATPANQLITNSVASPVTITLSNASSSTFGGVIADGPQPTSLLISAGNLKLTGPNSYSGNTSISQGALTLAGSGSIPNSPAISLGTNALFDVSAAAFSLGSGKSLSGFGTVTGNLAAANCSLFPGSAGLPGTLTFANNLALNGGVTVYFDLALDPNSPGNDLVAVGGTLTLSGLNTIQLNPVSGTLLAGTYRLFKFNSLIGSLANFQLTGSIGAGLQAALHLAPGELDLLVSQGEGSSFVWQGDGSLNSWDTLSTNWLLGLNPEVFTNGSFVAFNDSSTNTTVNLSQTLFPASVLLDATSDYTFAGPGKLSGAMSFTKTNSARLLVLTTNDYAGITTIAQGTVQVGNALNSGSLGLGTLLNNGLLLMQQPDSRSLPNNISGSGCLVQAGSAVLSLTGSNTYTGGTLISSGTLQLGSGGLLGSGDITNNALLVYAGSTTAAIPGSISGSGSLTLSGPGTLALSGNNSFTGPVTVNAGTLLLNNLAGSATGSGSVTVNSSGKLGGSGIILGSLTVNSGGTLMPGNPVGLLTISNNLSLNPGAILNYALGSNSDSTLVSGNLLLNGTLNITDSGGLGNSTNVLFSYGGSLTVGNFVLGAQPAGRLYAIDTNTPGKVSLLVGVVATNVPAFPGAVGFAARATGGRGGKIYHVTNLADSGPGSFRDAVSQSKRIVVFDVGGYINLSSAVVVQDNLTIAGQTAPGDGVGVMGREVSFGNATNVVCRFFRFRQGDLDPDNTKSGINVGIGTNLLFDHISIEFAQWNNIDAVTCDAITIQNSILADPIYQQFNAHTEQLGANFAWYNNIFANAHNRNPLAKINTIYVNNLIYNFQAGYTVANTSGDFSHDIINNYFVCGPSTTTPSDDFFQMNSGQDVYASGNLLDSAEDGTLAGSLTVPGGVTTLSSPWSPLTSTLSTLDTLSALKRDLSGSGALPRDQVDSLVLADVSSFGTSGHLWTSQTQTGLGNSGYGTLNGGSPPLDSDADGLPDSWELALRLDPTNPNDSTNLTLTGYTQLELYLNWLGAPHATVAQNSSLDIDLAQFTSGFSNGPSFSLSNPTNGSATLLPDHHTVRFTPAPGFFGLGAFAWSVTDAAGSSMSDTITLLVTRVSAPRFDAIRISNNALVLNGSGGIPGKPYYLLTSSNLALPQPQWTTSATNQFDSLGNFILTNTLSASNAFYRLQAP